jgi:hypothetical protein
VTHLREHLPYALDARQQPGVGSLLNCHPFYGQAEDLDSSSRLIVPQKYGLK